MRVQEQQCVKVASARSVVHCVRRAAFTVVIMESLEHSEVTVLYGLVHGLSRAAVMALLVQSLNNM